MALTEVNNRYCVLDRAARHLGLDVAFDPAVYPDDVWRADTIRQYFDQISGSGNSNLFNDFFTFDFDTARNIAAGLRGADRCTAPARTSRPIVTSRKNRRAPIVQFSQAFDTAMPIHAALGVRYEQTDVTSSALVPSPTGISWAVG